jgi:hypothetical protein
MTWRSKPCSRAGHTINAAEYSLSRPDQIPKCRRSSDRPCSQSPAPAAAGSACWCPVHTCRLAQRFKTPPFPTSFPATAFQSPGPDIYILTLKAKCSKKCAVPLVSSVSALLPASMKTPTVAVWAYGECSVATCNVVPISTQSLASAFIFNSVPSSHS